MKKPEYWDDRVTTSGARVAVVKDSPEWIFVLSKFHVGGFSKPVLNIERVQVGPCRCLCGDAADWRTEMSVCPVRLPFVV